MTKKTLMAGLACWSVMAVGQASGNKDQAASAKDAHPKEVASGQASGNVAAPKDLSSGHSSGKVANQPAGSAAVLNSSDAAASQPVEAPRDMATGQSSGKRQYQPVVIRKVSDDLAPESREQQSPKATGKTAQDDWTTPAARVAKGDVNGDGKADVAATNSASSSSSSTGQARVAAADVNGDGKADAAINTSHSNIKNAKDAPSGQTTGKRQHDVVVTKSTDAASPK
jgi:hypothetical protein